MRFLLLCLLSFFLSLNVFAQFPVVLLNDSNTYTNEGQPNCDSNQNPCNVAPCDQAIVTNFGPFNISNCSSYTISLQYSGDEWIGSGNLESADECGSFGDCAGDPNNPLAGGCCNCWDYLYLEFMIDGVEEYTFLVGDNNQSDTNGTIQETFCSGTGTDASFQITTQTWGNGETIEFSNIVLLCWENTNFSVEAQPDVTYCPGEDVDLVANTTLDGPYSWIFDPTGVNSVVATTTTTTLIAGTFSEGEYVFTVTDRNDCTATESVVLVEQTSPPINDPNIAYCANDNVDLTSYTNAVNSSGAVVVSWYNGQPSAGGSIITDPTDADIDPPVDLWVLVSDGGCDSEQQINPTINAAPNANAITIDGCQNTLLNYDLTTENNNVSTSGTVIWYDGQPTAGGSPIADPTDVNLFGGGLDFWVEVVSSDGCSTEVRFTVSITGNPSIFQFPIADCSSNLSSYDLSSQSSNVNSSGTVTWYDGQPSTTGSPIINTTSVDLSTGAIELWVQVDDGNGCTSEEQFTVTVEPDPTANDPNIDYCAPSLINLNDFESAVNNSENVTWYDGDPYNGGIEINPHSNVNLSSIAQLYALVTDGNNCSSSVLVTVNNSVGGDVNFGGDVSLCVGECTFANEGFSFIFSNGAEPFTLDLSINLPAPFGTFNLPAFALNVGEELGVCSQGAFPNFIANPPTLVIPAFVTGTYSVTLLSAVDANGCAANIGVNTAMLTIENSPNLVDPNIPDDCADNVTNFNLTAFDNSILPGSTIMWYDGDPDAGGVLIANPSNVDLNAIDDLWVVADDGSGCEALLNINDPNIDPGPTVSFDPGPYGICIDQCVDIPINFGGSSTSYQMDFELSSSFFTDSGIMTIDPSSPFVTLCIDGFGLSADFDDNSNTITISELLIAAGFTSGLLTINWISDDSGCMGQVLNPESVQLQLNTQPSAVPAALEVCDVDNNGVEIFDLTTLDGQVNNGSGSSVSYFESSDGSSQINNPNSYASQTNTVYASVFNGSCESDIVEISLSLEVPLTFQNPGNQSVCGEYILPSIQVVGSTSSNALYYTGPLGAGIQFNEGDIISSDMTLYIFDASHGDCQDNPTFDITINNELTAGDDIETDVCAGATIDLSTLLDNQDNGGFFEDDQENSVNTMITITGAVGTAEIYQYIIENDAPCENDTATITLNVETELNAGAAQVVDTCSIEIINLSSLLESGASLGGIFNDNIGNAGAALSGNTFDAAVAGPGIYSFDYLVNAVGCDPQQTTISVTIQEQPQLLNVADTTSCDFYMIEAPLGVGVSGISGYYSESGGMGDTYNVGDIITSSQIIYLYADNGTCTDELAININITDTPDAGQDSIISPCLAYQDELILNDYISASGAAGGSWNELSNESIIINPSSQIDLTSLSGTDLSFEYTITSAGCSDTAQLDIQWAQAPLIGSDAILEFCASDSLINLDGLIGIHDAGGVWSQVAGSISLDLSDSTSLDISAVNQNETFQFSYTIAGTSLCPESSSMVELTIFPELDAGSDLSLSVCEGAIVDLQTEVNGDLPGIFIDAATGAQITDTEVETNGMSNNTLNYQYVVCEDCLVCTPDTADIAISIVDNVSAGTDVVGILVCEGENILLTDLLIGADMPGVFSIITGTGQILNSTYTAQADAAGEEIMIQYNVGDGIECPKDSSTIMLDIVSPPSAGFGDLDNQLCTGSCGFFTLEISGGPGVTVDIEFRSELGDILSITLNPVVMSQQYEVCNDNGNLVFDGSIVLGAADIMWDVDIVGVSNALCDNPDVFETINFAPDAQVIEAMIMDVLCPDESILVNGQTFDINNPSGMELVPNLSGCDTMFTVDLQFLSFGENDLDDLYCDITSVNIGGEVFDIGNTTGVVVLEGQSANGCDSLINVDISFDSSSNAILDDLLCADQSIDILGTIYDINNPTGQDTLFGAASSGCDSIIVVNLSFEQDAESFISEMICDGDEIMIAGETFDANNTTDQIILENGASTGCDSIINVEVTIETISLNVTSEVITEGQSYQLDLNISGSYTEILWTPTDGLSCNDCPDPIASPSITTNYTALVFYGQDCMIDAMLSVPVLDVGPSIYIPNVFSPNGDAANNTFEIFSNEDILIAEFNIYDRWGELVYRGAPGVLSENYPFWDGTFKGEEVSQGVYVYVINYNRSIGSALEILTGDITILR